MSFIKKIKTALGIGSDVEIDDNPPLEIANLPTAPPQIDTDQPIEVSEEMMMKIFDKVVEVTNSSLPGYLASSVNADKQKKFLYDALDQSVKQYLAELDAKSQAKCMALWQNDRDELNRQMESLKQRAADLEVKRNEVNEQKLSSENQRRALTERVRVLEETVLKLEAEKEQYEIENRGLINKAKVAQVYETDMENMRQEIEMLRASVSPEAASEEIEKLQNEISRQQTEITRLGNEIESLEQVNDDLKETNDNLTEENGNLAQANEDLAQENKNLAEANDNMKESCEAAKIKTGMSDVMLKDLQKRTAELVQTVKEAEQTTADLTDELAVKEAKIADLTQIIEEKEARLAENEEMFEEFSVLSEQMTLFEDVKNRLQQKIIKLKEELKETQLENENLRSTIESNLNSQAMQQQAMQHTIEQLRNNNEDLLSSEDLSIDTDAL